ncbi:MAG: hypothetical protein CYPHOPRED_000387 [Cyphobasidiales sp. Tagirdzhanova-0007]|nr:MAG: hypothetical protein CYPHOPRED_000387 [Cyphobasidiales sp. Tagirdzhanova-0007]
MAAEGAKTTFKSIAASVSNTSTVIASSSISVAPPASDLSASVRSHAVGTQNLAPIFVKHISSKRERASEIEGGQDDLSSGREEKLLKTSGLESSASSTSPKNYAATEANPSEVAWQPSDPRRLLHGVFGQPAYSPKLACFDVDGTLVEPRTNNWFPRNAEDWQFWCPKNKVQARLREYHEAGYSIIFISNQNYHPNTKTHQFFKTKMSHIGNALRDIPFRILAATAKDFNYRKPDIGMWRLLDKLFLEQGVLLDKASCFFVGDAAGRPDKHPGKKTRKGDHAASDKEWAANVGISFYTPEEFFWNRLDKMGKGGLNATAKEFSPRKG